VFRGPDCFGFRKLDAGIRAGSPIFLQQRPAIIVSGTVRDSAGSPIVDASVFLKKKPRGRFD